MASKTTPLPIYFWIVSGLCLLNFAAIYVLQWNLSERLDAFEFRQAVAVANDIRSGLHELASTVNAPSIKERYYHLFKVDISAPDLSHQEIVNGIGSLSDEEYVKVVSHLREIKQAYNKLLACADLSLKEITPNHEAEMNELFLGISRQLDELETMRGLKNGK